MSEEENITQSDEDKDETELSNAEMHKLIVDQGTMMESMKTENASNMAAIRNYMEEKYGDVSEDVKNLTALLASGGQGDASGADELTDGDLSDPNKVTSLVDKRIESREKEKTEQANAESKAYYKDYADMATQLLDDEKGPDGKMLSPTAREGILNLLKTDVIDKYSDNGVRDAVKNFGVARDKFFGLGKPNPFKGEDTSGTGGGTGGSGGSGKKTVKLTEASRKLLADLGESEEWAQEVLSKQE